MTPADRKQVREALELALFHHQGQKSEVGNACRDALSLLDTEEAGSPWQPMETAPRDGTRILVAHELGVTTAEWLEIDSGKFGHFIGGDDNGLLIGLLGWMPFPTYTAQFGDKPCPFCGHPCLQEHFSVTHIFDGEEVGSYCCPKCGCQVMGPGRKTEAEALDAATIAWNRRTPSGVVVEKET